MGASLIAQLVKNPSAMQETPVWFLDWEDPLEEEMATHFSNLAWEIPMNRGACWGYILWGHRRVGRNLMTKQQTVVQNIEIMYYNNT